VGFTLAYCLQLTSEESALVQPYNLEFDPVTRMADRQGKRMADRQGKRMPDATSSNIVAVAERGDRQGRSQWPGQLIRRGPDFRRR
jgi:hypothetical protein